MIRQKLQRLTDLSFRDWLWLPPLVLSALAIAMAVKLAPSLALSDSSTDQPAIPGSLFYRLATGCTTGTN